MKPLLILLVWITSTGLSAQTELIRETFYTSGREDVIGCKVYLADKNGIIDKVITYNSDNEPQTEMIYRYENGRIVRHDEYSGSMRVKLVEYLYNEKGLLTGMNEIDSMNRKILSRTLIYQENRLVKIEDRMPDGRLFGLKSFEYNGGQISREILYNDRNQIQFTREYQYTDGRIASLMLYSASGRTVRITERVYHSAQTGYNSFGFPEKFYDLH